ncbi:hypothetical protein QL285_041919 [Trifolium repens]|nr:hypothetical protein QL285_041919 [Trifolium repens]
MEIDSAWIIGFNGNLVIANNMFVELLTLYHGLKISREACCNYSFCSSDSKIVLDLISKDHNSLHSYAATVTNINDLLKLKWEVSLFHSSREENSCAKFLAKLSSTNDAKLSILETPPLNMQYFLLSDALRVPYSRASLVLFCVSFCV